MYLFFYPLLSPSATSPTSSKGTLGGVGGRRSAPSAHFMQSPASTRALGWAGDGGKCPECPLFDQLATSRGTPGWLRCSFGLRVEFLCHVFLSPFGPARGGSCREMGTLGTSPTSRVPPAHPERPSCMVYVSVWLLILRTAQYSCSIFFVDLLIASSSL